MIDILLSTYNGAQYLEEQIDSILKQKYRDWKLLIRDDNSSDNTIEIIQTYQNKYPQKISQIKDNLGNLGSTLSFAKLLESSTSDYIMFCDQDDVWKEDKITITIEAMFRLEEENSNIPLSVFTDLEVVDENLNTISRSFIQCQKLDIRIVNNPTKLAALNVIAGCTCMINKKSLNVILPINTNKIIHDQWIGVNIAHYGKIEYIPYASILYRQHSNNVLGSYNISFSYFLKKISSPAKLFSTYKALLSNLQFKISTAEFLKYKIYYSIKRSFPL